MTAKQQVLERGLLEEFDRVSLGEEDLKSWFRDSLRTAAHEEQAAVAARRADASRRQTQLGERRKALLDLCLDGQLSKDDFSAKRAEIDDQLRRLAEEIEVLDRGGDEKADLAIRTFELAQSLKTRWFSSDLPEKRNLLRMTCSNLTWDGVKLVVEMRKPFDVFAEGLLVHSGRTERI